MKPDIVPNVDQPTNGGKETKKTHSHRTKNANHDCSHFSATGPSQKNTCPVKIMKDNPSKMASNAAPIAPILCQNVSLRHVFLVRRSIFVA